MTDLSVLFMLYTIVNYFLLSILTNTSSSSNLFNFVSANSFKVNKYGLVVNPFISNPYNKVLKSIL